MPYNKYFKIFFIDTYKTEKNHGLNTYTAQLGLALVTKVSLSYIWLNAPFLKKEANHIYIPKVNLANAQQELELAKLIIQHIGEISNPIFHFNWLNHLPIAFYLKQQINCKIVLTKHCIPWRDLVTNHYVSFYVINQAFVKGQPCKINNPKLLQEQLNYSFVDEIITVTQCAKKSLIQLFKIDKAKITVINNGLANNTIAIKSISAQLVLREKYGFSADEKLIIYAGNVNPRKGIFDVVKAFGKLVKKYPNVRLLIAGPGNYEGIIKLAKGYWSKITLLGSLDKPTLYHFYQMANIGLVPSYVEQCSYTCIEMMQSGLPLVVSDVDGLHEMVNDDCGLKIKVDFKKNGVSLNEKDLLTKLLFLLQNTDEATALGINARAYALKFFNSELMAEKTLEVYFKAFGVESAKLKVKSAELSIKNSETSVKRLKNKDQLTNLSLVSVVVPCYQAQSYLKECIESILKQTYPNFELILVNDGSTDDTENIIKAFKEPRVVYHKNKHNIGIAKTLNKGIKLAKGKYIARMDADDVMHPERLAKQVYFMERNLDYGLIGSWHNLSNTNGMPFRQVEGKEDNAEIQLAMLFYNPISHPTVMMRSELAKANPYCVKASRCEDHELWFRLAKQTKIYNLPQALVNYRIHQKATTAQHQKEMQQQVMELLSNELEKLGIAHTPQELLLHCAIGFGLGANFFNVGNRKEELQLWLDKIFGNPNYIKNYSKQKLAKMRRHILVDCCGVEDK